MLQKSTHIIYSYHLIDVDTDWSQIYKKPKYQCKEKKRLKRKFQDVSSGWHWKMDGLVAQFRNINHVIFNNNNSDNGINGLPLLKNSGVELASDTVGLR